LTISSGFSTGYEKLLGNKRWIFPLMPTPAAYIANGKQYTVFAINNAKTRRAPWCKVCCICFAMSRRDYLEVT
jgi:hypothetical protein